MDDGEERLAGEEWEDADGDTPAGPSSSSTTNAVGTALVVAVPASRLLRWLWARRASLGGVALSVAAGGPGVVGKGLLQLGAASLAASLLPGGWKAVRGLALVGCAPLEAGLQVRVRVAETRTC
jgi:hypothetical protein